MSERIPFRHLRQTLRLAEAQTALLLGVKQIDWATNDYAMFTVMVQMTKQTKNPSYAKMFGMAGAWLRFLKRLIAALPDDYTLKASAQVEFDKLAQGYEEYINGTN